MSLFDDLVKTYAETDLDKVFSNPAINISSVNKVFYSHLKVVTLAQWMVDSVRATNKLSTDNLNFGGMKWRSEMTPFATKVTITDTAGKDEDYCKFADIPSFIHGYWKFLTRSPYAGWEQNASTPQSFISFIGTNYSGSSSYASKVLDLLPEARQLIDAALGLPNTGASSSTDKLQVTKSPTEVIKTREKFVVEGVTPVINAGQSVTILVDGQFQFSGGVVDSVGKWSFDFSFLNPGNRSMKISIADESVTIVVRAVVDTPPDLSTVPGKPFTLNGSVGLGGQNDGNDVKKVKERLIELGFNWLKPDSSIDTGTIQAIKLFQSIVEGSTVIAGDGRIDVDEITHRFLQASNAPCWQLMPMKGDGFRNFEREDNKDNHDFGVSWLAETIIKTGKLYETTHRKGNSRISLLVVNDVSIPHGGDTPDHAGHESGNACDIFLPKKDGDFGDVTFDSSNYDRDAARAILKTLRKQELFSIAFFNDPILISEGLCEPASGHDNHIHFEIKPPQPA